MTTPIKTSATEAEIIAAVRAHAKANHDNGWDFIAEDFTDDDLLEELNECGGVTTIDAALKIFEGSVRLHEEKKSSFAWSEICGEAPLLECES